MNKCMFCGSPFDQDTAGRYGCPNCHGEGLGVFIGVDIAAGDGDKVLAASFCDDMARALFGVRDMQTRKALAFGRAVEVINAGIRSGIFGNTRFPGWYRIKKQGVEK